jgi:hypothetical protein
MIDGPYIFTAALAFFAMLGLDFVWAKYTLHLARINPVRASVAAAMIVPLNAIVTIAYVDQWSMAIWAALGAFVGTFISLKTEKK